MPRPPRAWSSRKPSCGGTAPRPGACWSCCPSIGQLVNIRATFSFAIADQADIRLSKELKGGSLMDVGCYCVSGSRLLAGVEPDRVYAEQVVGPSGVDIGFSGLLHFPGGVTSEIVSGFRMEHQGLEAIGTLGSIQVPDPWHSRAGIIVRNGEEIRLDAGNPYHAELDNMCAAIHGTAAPLLGRADALGQSRTIEALYRSADTGQASHPRRLTDPCAPCIAVPR